MTATTNTLRVIERWRGEGVELLPPADGSEVIERLAGLGRLISRDVVELYCAAGGMADGETDSTLLTLWTLERVVSENSERGGLLLLFFADSLIDSHFYGLEYENENESSVWVDYLGGHPHERVADSLDEFFNFCLRDPGRAVLIKD